MKKSLEQQSRELEEKQKQFDKELYFSVNIVMICLVFLL